MSQALTSKLDSHKIDQLVENIEFFRELGMHDELIANRLGITLDWLQTVLRRKEANGQRDPGQAP